jgi:hypothetical protein
MALFYCELAGGTPEPLPEAAPPLIRVSSAVLLTVEDRQRMLESGYPPAVAAAMAERFARGATLWLLKENGCI